MRKVAWFALCLTLVSPSVFAGQNAATNPATETDPVLRAMVDELNRSISQLKLNNLDTPYFIQYTVLEEDEYAAGATFGALRQSEPTKQRLVNAQVRVGNYDFDNSEFAGIAHTSKPVYGLQLHPEVTHTQDGAKILENFAVKICGAKQNWNMANFVDTEIARIRSLVGD